MLIVDSIFGRLGNNLYQLLGIIYMSNKLTDQINIDVLKKSELNNLIKLSELEIFVNKGKEKKQEIIRYNFFKLYQIDSSFNPKKEYFNIGKKILPFLKNKIIKYDQNTLMIHIRDLESHDYYTQYPLNFYVKIIQETNYQNIILITTINYENPVIKILKEKFPRIIIQNRGFSNFYSLLGCENVIIPRSTFSVTSLFLNPHLKKVYFVDDLINRDNFYDMLSLSKEEFPSNIMYNEYKLTTEYIHVGSWSISENNIIKMMTYPIKNIKKI